MFSVKTDNDLLREGVFLKKDINQLREDFKNLLTEQNGEYLAYKKDQEESINENFLNN